MSPSFISYDKKNIGFTGHLRRLLPKRDTLKRISPFVVLFASSFVIIPPTQLPPSPGSGGMIVEGIMGDFESFNPLFASNSVTKLIFPEFIGINPDTGLFERGVFNALATDWSVSEKGAVYTFKLRDNWVWSDGVPITSNDILYTWDAIKSGVVDTGLNYLKDVIVKLEAPDPTTIQITFATADCSALNNASALPVLPSHILPKDFSALNNSEFNTKPSVTGGVFRFGEFTSGNRIVLLANKTWAGTTEGVSPIGYTYKYVPDQTQLVDDFVAGKLDVILNPPPERRAELRNNPSINTYSFPGNTWDFMALNYADPLHPTNGRDENGVILDQGHHPLFGDVRVRQAIAKAIDVDTLIKGVDFGEVTRMASAIIPSSWAYDKNLQPIAYDLDEAKRLLDEAGWIDVDHNPNTPRIAKGAKYATDGTVFKFTLYTNLGGTRRTSIAALIRDQLRLAGIEVDYQAIDLNNLLDIIYDQKFDAFILGWRNPYPDDPDLTELFTPTGDVVGSGSNATSYYNPEVVDLNAQAHSLPGCDPDMRAKIYGKIQEIMQQDLPYIPLYSLNDMYAAQKTVKGFDPHPNQPYWNIDTWSNVR